AVSFPAWEAEESIRQPLSESKRLVQRTMRQAVTGGGSEVIHITKRGLSGAQGRVTLGEGMQLQWRETGSQKWSREDRRWSFDPAGSCEALQIRVEGKHGYGELVFHPLTALVMDEVYETRGNGK
ncbi:MAG: hypothetical protein AAF191_19985, partial [Verrucomicrobiota bacterium]